MASARRRLDGAGGKAATLFYHASPFQVAADLSGSRVTELGPSDLETYRAIIARLAPTQVSD